MTGASDGVVPGAGLAVVRHAATHPTSAPPVVLVHGTMDRGGPMQKVVRRLPDLDVTRYDRRGYGDSLRAGVAATVQAHVDDLLAVIGERPSVVFGHSFGGVLALCAAEQRPDVVAAVAAYEAPMSWTGWWPTDTAGGRAVHDHADDPAEAAEAFLRVMVGDTVWERLPDATRRARRAEGPALLAEMVALRLGAPYDPSRIAVPVIAAHGTASRPHHTRAAEELGRLVPDAEVVVVEGAGHGVHLSHPDAAAELVRRAVARAGHRGVGRP